MWLQFLFTAMKSLRSAFPFGGSSDFYAKFVDWEASLMYSIFVSSETNGSVK